MDAHFARPFADASVDRSFHFVIKENNNDIALPTQEFGKIVLEAHKNVVRWMEESLMQQHKQSLNNGQQPANASEQNQNEVAQNDVEFKVPLLPKKEEQL